MMEHKEFLDTFVHPGAAYRGKPFWSWNGELRGEELVRQVDVMKEMGLGGYFMHSRAGLITEYLGEDWFRLINEVADAGEARGMEVWLYDEDRWPSGSAGGKVTVDPQYRMKSLYVFESDPEKFSGFGTDTFSVFVGKVDGINLYGYKALKDGENPADIIAAQSKLYADKPGTWKVLHFRIIPDQPSSNYNGTTYIDTMSRKAVDRFLELTHEEYARRCGDRIGTTIKGIFTDEPHRGHCLDNCSEQDGVRSCAMCWTDDLFEEFVVRYGYDARPILPELFYRPDGEVVRPIKLNYIDLADNLFLERFAMPINEWCNRHGMIFTGHVLHEDALMNQVVPNGSLMRFYEHMGYPGIDCLTEHNTCYWIVKQLTSAARQLGKKWLLSELYGCTGWQFNLKSHKTVGDWQALFGINLRCQHLSWYTMEGESKRDYPASILHQSPWYHDYDLVESYFARFGFVMSEGKPGCDVLVLNPIESVFCQAYLGWAHWISNASAEVAPYEERYAKLFHYLTDNHIDFDYGEEQMMSDRWRVETDPAGKPVLRIGQAVYRAVVVGNMLTIRPGTLTILHAFMRQGGKVIFAGDAPMYVDAVRSEAPENLRKEGICVPFEEAAIVDAVRAAVGGGPRVTDENGAEVKDVFLQERREFDGGDHAVVLLNTDRKTAKCGLRLYIGGEVPAHLQVWDFETGKRYNADRLVHADGKNTYVAFSMNAAGTLCFVFTDRAEDLPVYATYRTVDTFMPSADQLCFTAQADEQNVCVLDYCRWRWADGEWHAETEALRADRQVRDSVGIEHRGGEMLQPWYAKLHDKKCYGALELAYDFQIDVLPEGEVFLAGERPEFNTYAINGVRLQAGGLNDFWIDDCFKKMPIPAGVLHRGLNTVTVSVDFMRTTNIEALYLVGDFGVRVDGEHDRVLTAPVSRITLGSLADSGRPFYSGCMTYRLTKEMYAGMASDGDRIVLVPDAPFAGCVRVSAGGKTTVLGWDPYEADVTDAVRAGEPIEVTVVGTRRNLFGPLHQIPALDGAYGPGNFTTGGKGWTDAYSLLDSGLHGVTFKVQKKNTL